MLRKPSRLCLPVLLCVAFLLGGCIYSPPPAATPIVPTATPPPLPTPVAPPTAVITPPAPAPRTAVPAAPAPRTATVPAAPALAYATPDVSLPQLVLTNSRGSAVRLYIEVADTPAKQETGLMNRTAMAEDQGMLFVFAGETTVPFWMKDTLLPLSIAFIKSDGRIVDLQDMQPLDESMHNPAQPYTYALEVNQGYFRRHGIAVGDGVSLPR
ncbi:MAG: DUF192 domain-containing protein [Chloroflexia bacterium]